MIWDPFKRRSERTFRVTTNSSVSLTFDLLQLGPPLASCRSRTQWRKVDQGRMTAWAISNSKKIKALVICACLSASWARHTTRTVDHRWGGRWLRSSDSIDIIEGPDDRSCRSHGLALHEATLRSKPCPLHCWSVARLFLSYMTSLIYLIYN